MRTIIVAALGAFGGTLGYAYILNAPKNTILPASFIGLAGYMAYVLRAAGAQNAHARHDLPAQRAGAPRAGI